MQIILERDSIDKPLTFNVCLLQLIFHTVCSPITYSCKGVFNHQILPRVCTLVLFIILGVRMRTMPCASKCDTVTFLCDITATFLRDVTATFLRTYICTHIMRIDP